MVATLQPLMCTCNKEYGVPTGFLAHLFQFSGLAYQGSFVYTLGFQKVTHIIYSTIFVVVDAGICSLTSYTDVFIRWERN